MVRREPMYLKSRMTRTPRKVLATRTKRMTRKLLLFISLDRYGGITTGTTKRKLLVVLLWVLLLLLVLLLVVLVAARVANSALVVALVVVPRVVPLAVLVLALPLIVLMLRLVVSSSKRKSETYKITLESL